jgi:TPP-dependent pyruvate/acetoin dehydrogenase alpha subunit
VNGVSDFIGSSTALKAYRDMLRIRLLEDAIAMHYSEWEMRCPVHLCTGQEAIPVGVSAWLGVDDLVFSSHRSHGHYLAKGGDLKALVAELYGRVTGCARGKGGSQHLVDLGCGFMGSAPILASTMSVGVGAAWAKQRRAEDGIVVVYFGDGATEEGAFHESLHFAALHKTPVLFVCENNLYSVQASLPERQAPNRTIADLASAHGMTGVGEDGNDVEAVHRIAGEVITQIRQGKGPALIEFETYRFKEHVGPNDDLNLGYRSHEEWASWKERCPVEMLASRLMDAGGASEDELQKMQFDLQAEVDDAFAFAKASPFPGGEELMEHVYPNSGETR